MTKGGGDHWAYMEKVLEDTRRYSRELLVEHEKLRARTLVLETQRARLEEDLLAARRAATLCAEHSVAVEQKNSHLTLLCGASYRIFQGTLDRREVLLRIREVVADVVGSEEIAIFSVAPDRPLLRLEQSFGAPASFPEIPLGSGLIGRSVQQGQPWVAGRSPGGEPLPCEKDLQASIPLVADGRAVGALAIFRLLPQKPALEKHDLDTFEILATHAGTALHCASLLSRVRDPIAS
jgi:GAF domain